MALASAFIIVHVLSATLYAGLACYVVSNRGPRLANLPFAVFCTLQAFDALGFLLLNSATAQAGIPELLRLQAAAALLAPPFFLHVAFIPLRGTRSRLRQALVVSAFAIGGSGAVLAGLTDRLFTGSIVRGLPGAHILTPLLSPTGHAVVVLSLASSFAILVPVLAYVLWRAGSRHSISDARLLLPPSLLLILSLACRGVLINLPPAAPASLLVDLAIAEQSLSLLAGLLLANNVLRYGSPAGRPIHFGLGPLAIAGWLAVLVDIGLLLYPGHTGDGAYLLAPVLTSMVTGVLLARPEVLRLTDRWLGRQPPTESAFASRLRLVWQRLAIPQSGPMPFLDLAGALRAEIDAAYVEILELSGSPDPERDHLTFTRGTDGPEMHIRGSDLEWPITETNSHPGRVVSLGLGGPANLVLPILSDGHVAGVLAVGEPQRGGVYARGEVMRAELLADLLSAALSAHIPIVGDSGTPGDNMPAPAPPPKTLAILAFGRLELTSPHNTLARTPPIPLRARQLLAYLLTAYPNAVPGETLMDRVWPEASPATASNNLHVAIYSLRRALEPGLSRGGASHYILHEDDAYRLNLDHRIWVDVRAFEDAYRRGTQMLRASTEPGIVARVFQEALGLYRGPFLTEVALDLSPEVEAVRYRLQHHAEEMARFVVGHLCSEGQWKEAKGLLVALREADPWDDAFIEMLAQVWAGPDQAPQGSLKTSLAPPPEPSDS